MSDKNIVLGEGKDCEHGTPWNVYCPDCAKMDKCIFCGKELDSGDYLMVCKECTEGKKDG
jgi:hypothetical protein